MRTANFVQSYFESLRSLLSAPPASHPHISSPSRRSARLDFNFALILPEYISPTYTPLLSLSFFFSRHSSQPCSAFTFRACSLFSSFPHARRQLRDATNCSRVYRHIIITRKSAGSIIARDLIRFEFKCTLLRFDLHDSFFLFPVFYFLLDGSWKWRIAVLGRGYARGCNFDLVVNSPIDQGEITQDLSGYVAKEYNVQYSNCILLEDFHLT